MFRDEEKKIFESSKKCKCAIPCINAEETNFGKKLRRFRNKNCNCPFCPLYSKGVLEKGLHILCRMHGKRRGMSIFHEYNFLKNNYLDHLCIHDGHAFLKKRTGILKLAGPKYHPLWRIFCYWEVQFGYREYKIPGGLEEDVKTWLVKEKILGGGLGERDYLALQAEELFNYFGEEWHMPKDVPTLDEWLTDGKWMRGKAGTGPRTYVTVEGKKMKTRAMKGIDAANRSDKVMRWYMLHPTRERMVILEKK